MALSAKDLLTGERMLTILGISVMPSELNMKENLHMECAKYVSARKTGKYNKRSKTS